MKQHYLVGFIIVLLLTSVSESWGQFKLSAEIRPRAEAAQGNSGGAGLRCGRRWYRGRRGNFPASARGTRVDPQHDRGARRSGFSRCDGSFVGVR